jgi:hypothetical protein
VLTSFTPRAKIVLQARNGTTEEADMIRNFIVTLCDIYINAVGAVCELVLS